MNICLFIFGSLYIVGILVSIFLIIRSIIFILGNINMDRKKKLKEMENTHIITY